MSLPRAFAAVVVSGALLTGAAALAPAASAATSPAKATTTAVTTTAKVVAPVLRAPAPTGHLRVVVPGVLSVTLLGHLR